MDHETHQRVDVIAKHVDAWLPRRRVVQGLGALALGALGLAGIDQVVQAKRCEKRCKDHCKSRHRRRGSNRQCRRVCRQRCT
jgi:hypothetical protein